MKSCNPLIDLCAVFIIVLMAISIAVGVYGYYSLQDKCVAAGGVLVTNDVCIKKEALIISPK